MNLSETRLSEVVAAAHQSVAGDKRWTNAINHAAEMIESNPYLHWTGDSLLMLSESGEIYEANGVCQCKAYRSGQPCKLSLPPSLIAGFRQ